jgi:hypothetical protein
LAVELKKNLCRETFLVTFFEKKVRMLVQITPLAQGCPIETQLGGGCTAVGIFFKVYQPLVGLALGKGSNAKPACFWAGFCYLA